MATDASGANAAAATENAYEKLSREVHQMQITGAIHSDWLENPKGFLLKPDFKRKLQHVGAGGKRLQNSSRGLRLHLPGNSYRLRWFVLDGMMLRYFKTDSEEQELGAIHLSSVNAVLPSSVADAPEHALDLVCADRIYTVAGNDREDMVRWATVLTLVLRGEYKPKLMQRPESTIIRGSSAIPRPSAMARKTSQQQQLVNGSSRFTDARMTSGLHDDADQRQKDDDVKEKIITVTFDQPGPLHLMLRGTVDDEVMVCGFEDTATGLPGPAEASGAIRVGDVLISVNQNYFTAIEFQQALALIRSAGRPLTLRFSRIEYTTAPEPTRMAEGWVLAKEPAAHRYRIRMLQLHGDRLKLYKPSMEGGRLEEPCWVLRMADIMDIRPTNDSREIVTAYTQCHPKQWGVTLEATQTMFTFYTKSKHDMLQWIDLLKNSPVFAAPKNARLSIPVHPITSVEFNPVLEPNVLLEDDVCKVGDLMPTVSRYRFVLLEDGKMMYYLNQEFAATRTRPIGTIRCDSIISIIPSQYSAESSVADTSASFVPLKNTSQHLDNEAMAWRLEIGILVNGSLQKYRRSFIMCFETQEKMMKWGMSIGREAKRLTGQEYDLTSVTRRYSRSNSYANSSMASNPRQSADMTTSRSLSSRLVMNPLKYKDARVQDYPPLYRSLKDVAAKSANRGWFFVKKPRTVGFEAYHPRFVVLREHELMLFKYEVLDEENLHSYATLIDLRTIKDVREAESGYQENLDFTIQLTTSDDIVWMFVAETYGQKETWLSTLIWMSDYYYRSSQNEAESRTQRKPTSKLQGHAMSMIPETEDEDQTDTSQPLISSRSGLLLEAFTVSRGWIQIRGKKVFGAISNGMFSYYEKEEDYTDEWGDAIDAVSLRQVEDVHSDGFMPESFVINVKGENEVQLIAESASAAKQWMLVMCSCGDLILKKLPKGDLWASTQPKEAWIWKLDRLYQVFRRRYFSLRNHQLIYQTAPNGRPLGIIALPCIFYMMMSKVCTRSKDEADFYQLEISFASNSSPHEADEGRMNDQTGDFYALLMAFDTEEALRDWATSIYDCCTNSMSIKAAATLAPLSEIQVLPKELLKTCVFDHDDGRRLSTPAPFMSPSDREKPSLQPATEFSSRGWLYYRTSPEERIRLRYFVQWGYELSIYKHEVLADESSAIRYGVIDCRALVDVRFAFVNSPENAVELLLAPSHTSVILIPQTDHEAVMWRNSLLDIKRAFGYDRNQDQVIGSGLLISRGSTFATHKDNEELLRGQIEASVLHSGHLQEWDGSKWIPKYFVLTNHRVLMLSLAVHLYDEEPDLLGSFATKDLMEVRSCQEAEVMDAGDSSFVIHLRTSTERLVIKCDNVGTWLY